MKILLLLFLTLASITVNAKDKIVDISVLDAEPPLNHISPGLNKVADTKRAAISMRQPNRLSVKGGKIERFVADPQMLEIKHDAGTGALFIVPLVRETTGIFVMTDSGHTYSVVLTPSEKLHSQNLEIEETHAKPKAQIPIDTALPIEEAVQNIFRNLTQIVSDKSLASKNSKKAVKIGALKAVPDRKWQTGGYWLEHWTLTNTSQQEESLEEAKFWEKGILSVGIDRAKLRPGEKVDLWIVRQGGSS